MIPWQFLKMFAGYVNGWKTVFDYKITSIAVYATYSDGRQEKYSFPLDIKDDIVYVTHQVLGRQQLRVAKTINVNEECNEWFSCKEGYGLSTYPETQKKIADIYMNVISEDASGDVFFTFEPSIQLDSIEKPGDFLPNFTLGGLL